MNVPYGGMSHDFQLKMSKAALGIILPTCYYAQQQLLL